MAVENTPKVFKKGYGSNFVIPFAIVLIGSLIIFGVTKMLQTDRGYKDLVSELHSKTFGNRWIAAFELSKVIAAKGIKDEDIPWLVDNLNSLYASAVDIRTKNFIVVTLGAVGNERGVETVLKALEEKDPQTQFHAIVALSKMNLPSSFDWSPIMALLSSQDEGLKQGAILTLATHRVSMAQDKLVKLLEDPSQNIRFASATALIYYKDIRALSVIQKVLNLNAVSTNKKNSLNSDKVYGLKLNILNGLKKTEWNELAEVVKTYSKKERNLKLVSLSREVLNELNY